MDGRRPAGSPALPRKRAGHRRGTEDEENDNAMQRRRRWWRRDNTSDEEDDWLERRAVEALALHDTDNLDTTQGEVVAGSAQQPEQLEPQSHPQQAPQAEECLPVHRWARCLTAPPPSRGPTPQLLQPPLLQPQLSHEVAPSPPLPTASDLPLEQFLQPLPLPAPHNPLYLPPPQPPPPPPGPATNTNPPPPPRWNVTRIVAPRAAAAGVLSAAGPAPLIEPLGGHRRIATASGSAAPALPLRCDACESPGDRSAAASAAAAAAAAKDNRDRGLRDRNRMERYLVDGERMARSDRMMDAVIAMRLGFGEDLRRGFGDGDDDDMDIREGVDKAVGLDWGRMREWMRERGERLQRQLMLEREMYLVERDARRGGNMAEEAATAAAAAAAAEPPLPPSPPPSAEPPYPDPFPPDLDLCDAVPADAVSGVMENRDLLKAILGGLGVAELCRAACVSRLWRRAADDRAFWRRLDLLGRQVTSEQVLRLCRRQAGVIEELRLGGSLCLHEDHSLLHRLTPALTSLVILELQHWTLNDRSMSRLSGGLPWLRELTMKDVHIVGPLGSQADVTLSHPGITSLDLFRFKAGRLTLTCPSLERLSIAASQLTALAATGASLPHLHTLSLTSLQRLSDNGLLAVVTSLTALRALLLADVPVPEELLRGVARCLEHLTRLEMSDCAGLSLSPARGPPAFAGGLRRLVVRRCESLSGGSAGLLVEGAGGSLEEAVVEGCGQVAAFCPAAALPALRNLSLRGCRLLATLELKARRLEELHLGSLQPGGPGGAVLRRVLVASNSLQTISWRHLPALEDLVLDCPALASLSLTDCDSLTDKVFDMLTDVQEVALAPPPQLPHPRQQHEPAAQPAAAPGPVTHRARAAAAQQPRLPQRVEAQPLPRLQVGPPRRYAAGAVPPPAPHQAPPQKPPPPPLPPQQQRHPAVGPQEHVGASQEDPGARPRASWDPRYAAGEGQFGRGHRATTAAGEAAATAMHMTAARPSAGIRRVLRAVVPGAAVTAGPAAAGAAHEVKSRSDSDDSEDEMRHDGEWERLCRRRPAWTRAASAAAAPATGGAATTMAVAATGAVPSGAGGGAGGAGGAAAAPGSAAQASGGGVFRWMLHAGGGPQQQPPAKAGGQQAALRRAAAEQPLDRPQAPSQPVSSQPVSSQPVSSQPVSSQPVSSQPVSSQPVSSQPVSSQPASSQPVSSQPVSSPVALMALPLPEDDPRVEVQPQFQLPLQPPLQPHFQPHLAQQAVEDMEAAVAAVNQLVAAVAVPLPPPLAAAPHPSWMQMIEVEMMEQEQDAAHPQPQPQPQQAPQPPAQQHPLALQPQAQLQAQARGMVVCHPKMGGCPQLQELRLEGCEGLRHARLRHGRLATVSLRGCRGLQTLRLSCPVLGALLLEECGELGSVALAPAGLASLSLGACCALREAELTCPSLEALSLKGCGSLQRVALDCPRLEELDATFCGELTDAALAAALCKGPPLTSLLLSVCCSLGPAVPGALGGLAGLRHLDLSYSCVSRLAPVLSGCSGLTTLCLGSCRELEAGGEELMWLLPDRGHALPYLSSLDVSYCPLSPHVVVSLVRGITHLTHLALNGCAGVDEGVWRCAVLPLDGQQGTGEKAVAVEEAEVAAEVTRSWSVVSRLEKLSMVRCSGLTSLCLGLVPERDDGGDDGTAEAGGNGGVVMCVGSVGGNGGGGRGAGRGWQWPGGDPPRRSLLGPPWRPAGCVLTGLRSLRLGLSGVQAVALALPHLTHLDLNGCSALRHLELRCPHLTELHLQACCSLPADLWAPLLQALGGNACGADGLTVLDAQHSGLFGEAVAATLAAAAVMAAAAEGDVDTGPGCSGGAGSGSGVAGNSAAGSGRPAGLGVDAAVAAPPEAAGAAAGAGGRGGGGGGSSAGVSCSALLAARDQPWWLLPRGATVLACGADCPVCGRRNRQAMLGLSGS